MDLAVFTLHKLHTASDSIIIGDGTCLSIANIDSFTLPSLPTPLLLTNVLYMPAISKNLTSVSAICADNLVNVLFFYSFFQVQDCHIRSIWFAGNVETVSITGRRWFSFGLPPLFYLLQICPRFPLSPCGIVVSVIRLYIFFANF